MNDACVLFHVIITHGIYIVGIAGNLNCSAAERQTGFRCCAGNLTNPDPEIVSGSQAFLLGPYKSEKNSQCGARAGHKGWFRIEVGKSGRKERCK